MTDLRKKLEHIIRDHEEMKTLPGDNPINYGSNRRSRTIDQLEAIITQTAVEARLDEVEKLAWEANSDWVMTGDLDSYIQSRYDELKKERKPIKSNLTKGGRE